MGYFFKRMMTAFYGGREGSKSVPSSVQGLLQAIPSHAQGTICGSMGLILDSFMQDKSPMTVLSPNSDESLFEPNLLEFGIMVQHRSKLELDSKLELVTSY